MGGPPSNTAGGYAQAGYQPQQGARPPFNIAAGVGAQQSMAEEKEKGQMRTTRAGEVGKAAMTRNAGKNLVGGAALGTAATVQVMAGAARGGGDGDDASEASLSLDKVGDQTLTDAVKKMRLDDATTTAMGKATKIAKSGKLKAATIGQRAGLNDVLHADGLSRAAGHATDAVKELGNRAEAYQARTADLLAKEMDLFRNGAGHTELARTAGAARGMVNESSIGSCARAVSNFRFNFVLFDIFRDFIQILGLFFNGLEFPDNFRAFFGNMFTLLSLDIELALPDVSSVGFFFITNAVSLVGITIFLFKRMKAKSRAKDGHDYVDWAGRNKRSRILSQIGLTLLISLYLPASRNSVAVVSCHEDYFSDTNECWTSTQAVFMGIFACISLLVTTIGLPLFSFRLIVKNRPQPVLFDEEGNAREYTDEHYRLDLARDSCPYNFLYQGYERKWAFYKVIVMVVKLVLVIPIVVLVNYEAVQLYASTALVTLFAALSWSSAPFIRDEDDRIDQAARTTTVLTVIGAVVVYHATDIDDTMGLVLNVLNIVNLVVMIAFAIASFDKVKRKWKIWRNRVDWTPDEDGRVRTFDEHLHSQRKRRFWMKFWDSLFFSDDRLEPAAARLMDLKHTAQTIGVNRYYQELKPPRKSVAVARQWAVQNLEGVDCFWDGDQTVSGKVSTFFGRVHILRFPFEAWMVYDEGPYVQISNDDFEAFVERNKSQDVVRRRNVRHQLRAMNQQMVYFPIQATKSKSTGSGDNKKTFSVQFQFTYALMTVKGNDSDSDRAPGFEVRLQYSDGVGSGGGRTYTNEHYTVSESAIGMTPTYQITDSLNKLLVWNRAVVAANFGRVLERQRSYRNELIEVEYQKQCILSYSFWYCIFNNDLIDRKTMTKYLRTVEQNELVSLIPDTHAEGVHALFARLHLFDSHPCIGYWMCFWDDFYENNADLKVVVANPEVFDPAQPTSLMYNPAPRDEIEAVLLGCGARTSSGRGLFNDKLLGELFDKLEQIGRQVISQFEESMAASASSFAPGSTTTSASSDGSSATASTSASSSADSSDDASATDDDSSASSSST